MNEKRRNQFKQLNNKIISSPFTVVFFCVWKAVSFFKYRYYMLKWHKIPLVDEQNIEDFRANVTFVFKSFERQKQAKKLYYNIQKYYPGIKVVIADDSSKPLSINDDFVEIVQLPFNSGISVGLNKALERVKTPYVIRLDDDELLTPFVKFEKHYDFLKRHDEVDLVGVLNITPVENNLKRMAMMYYQYTMANAPKKLKIPHLTKIDDYVVVAKPANNFIVRTDKLREVGYDDNIRMIDHHEFFYRAAGVITSVLAPDCFLYHDHNPYDMHYRKYRNDVRGDSEYIFKKHNNY